MRTDVSPDKHVPQDLELLPSQDRLLRPRRVGIEVVRLGGGRAARVADEVHGKRHERGRSRPVGAAARLGHADELSQRKRPRIYSEDSGELVNDFCKLLSISSRNLGSSRT